ncbi:MAG: SDR family oxidoreductase [Candidatus Eremiobacteraeota bacterium]|nr:SDR family oxidoreductase [Candidatus Eremiobacteraeota bacterium]
MSKVVVTGGAGFIGSHLVERLVADGHDVVTIDNLAVGRRSNLRAVERNGHFSFHALDLNDPSAAALFAGAHTVFHLAALADIVPSIERPESYFRANVDGTFAVVECARRSGVRRIVYAGSSSCYGIPDFYPTPETAEIRPQYPYALTKYLGECIALHWGKVYGIPSVSLRFFNVFGPRARTSGTYGAVFGVFLAQKLAGKPFTVVGDGTQTRDFTYVSDIVDGIVAAADSDVKDEAINLGSGGTYSINELVGLLNGPVQYIPKRPGEPDSTFADVTKAKRLLNWEAKVSFAEGVRSMLEHIDDWRDAPVWDAESIHKATEAWFRHLSTA